MAAEAQGLFLGNFQELNIRHQGTSGKSSQALTKNF
jgi:hypothetical protein